jgi:SAM-dependent methyltransferase
MAPGVRQNSDRSAFVQRYNAQFHREAGARPVACLCGSERTSKLFGKDRHGLTSPTVVCRQCGLVYTSPRPTEAFMQEFYRSDAYRYFYEGANGHDYLAELAGKYADDNFIHSTCRTYLAGLSDKRRPRVLEVGAGGGWNLQPFLTDCDVVGFDYSPMLCEMGRQRGINLLEGGLERLDSLEAGFDLIIANHVIEHFFDVVAAIKAMASKLAPNGLLYIGVPDIAFHDISQIQNAHNYYFTQGTLGHYCAVAGLAAIAGGKDASNLHQFALFRRHPAGQPRLGNLAGEYEAVMQRHRRYVARNLAAAALSAVGLRGAVRSLRGRLSGK